MFIFNSGTRWRASLAKKRRLGSARFYKQDQKVQESQAVSIYHLYAASQNMKCRLGSAWFYKQNQKVQESQAVFGRCSLHWARATSGTRWRASLAKKRRLGSARFYKQDQKVHKSRAVSNCSFLGWVHCRAVRGPKSGTPCGARLHWAKKQKLTSTWFYK